jgi:peptidoglycan/xylan/chitin deacetylase (PgdA/CDA1 family)
MRTRLACLIALALGLAPTATLAKIAAGADIEPHMRIASGEKFGAISAVPAQGTATSFTPVAEAPEGETGAALPGITVALTLDACSGAVDDRILSVLVDNRIPATIFATHRWIQHNPVALATLLAHPDLFEIENHGDQHVPAVTDHPTVFGLKTAGTIAEVKAEVEGGSAAVLAATGRRPHWFRGATARYSLDAVAEIEADGYAVAGYSLNADMGASLPADRVARRIAAARNGDVIIAHINQPTRASGAGVATGILALQRAGARFMRLEDVVIEAAR